VLPSMFCMYIQEEKNDRETVSSLWLPVLTLLFPSSITNER
jgi:hypothetical protein